MRQTNRKSAPGVRDGKVQKKNRTASSPDYYIHDSESLVIHRLRPKEGFYHAVSVTDVRRFIALIPDWDVAAQSVRAVVLTPGDDYCYGRYNNAGIIKLDAWPKHHHEVIPSRKAWLLNQMNIEAPVEAGYFVLRLTANQAKCFLLMGTFLHELGHHVDRMNTRSRLDAANGEPFAIAYEQRRQRELWDAYVREFGEP